MPFTYSLFESIPTGKAVKLRVEHANELRLAVLERGTAIGFTPPSLPAAVVCQTAKVSWLNAMRDAIEEIIDEGKYGRLVGAADSEVWTAWTLADLLTEVHSTFSDCGAGAGWIAVAQYDCVIGEHLREMYYACEVLAYCVTATPSLTVVSSDHKSGSGATTGDCETDYDAAAWTPGKLGSNICSSAKADTGAPDYRLYREREVSFVTLNEPIDLKELWVANYSYEYVWVKPVIYFDAVFGTPVSENRGYLDGTSSFRAYAKLDPVGGVAKNGVLDLSYESFDYRNVAGIWDLVIALGGIEPTGCLYVAELVGGMNNPEYFSRPNFARSKFLWTM